VEVALSTRKQPQLIVPIKRRDSEINFIALLFNSKFANPKAVTSSRAKVSEMAGTVIVAAFVLCLMRGVAAQSNGTCESFSTITPAYLHDILEFIANEKATTIANMQAYATSNQAEPTKIFNFELADIIDQFVQNYKDFRLRTMNRYATATGLEATDISMFISFPDTAPEELRANLWCIKDEFGQIFAAYFAALAELSEIEQGLEKNWRNMK